MTNPRAGESGEQRMNGQQQLGGEWSEMRALHEPVPYEAPAVGAHCDECDCPAEECAPGQMLAAVERLQDALASAEQELAKQIDSHNLTMMDRQKERARAERAERQARELPEQIAQALREAADEWPIGVCAHRCFREDEHVAPKDCLLGPDWLLERAARIARDHTTGGQ